MADSVFQLSKRASNTNGRWRVTREHLNGLTKGLMRVHGKPAQILDGCRLFVSDFMIGARDVFHYPIALVELLQARSREWRTWLWCGWICSLAFRGKRL